jgi:hypothetical protein
MAPQRDDEVRRNEAPAGTSPAADGGILGRRGRRFRRGDWVEVCDEAEISATLDAEGKLEGLPFLPEMRQFCGHRYRVYRRAERIFLDHYYYIARLKNTVFLEGVRCNGAAHAECQMHCLLFWKEAWLKPAAEDGGPGVSGPAARDDVTPTISSLAPRPRPKGEGTDCQTLPSECFCCQATELVRAARRLPWWDFRQYLRDLRDGKQRPGEMLGFFVREIARKIRRVFGRSARLRPPGAVATAEVSAPAEKLDLQPGEWVEIKTLAEILATLDVEQRHRGLGFSPEMTRYCGRRFRVAYRVERVILEWSGQMRRIRDTVALENAICEGQCFRNCPRSCYLFWREAWLKRIEE